MPIGVIKRHMSRWKDRHTSEVAKFYFLLITLIQLYCLVVYPTWYAPDGSAFDRLFFFHLFFASIVINVHLIPRLVDFDSIPVVPRLPVPNRIYWVISGAYVLGLVPFIDFPVLSLLDSHFHTAFPAAVVEKLDQIFTRISRGHVDIHMAAYLSVILLTYFVLFMRESHSRILNWVTCRRLVVFSYPLLLVAALALISFPVLETMGKVKWFHRYPPIGKTLFGLSYSLLGIENYAGRVTQILFALATGYVLFLMAEYLPFTDAEDHSHEDHHQHHHSRPPRPRFPILTLFYFNPFIGNVLFYDHIEVGTVFFSIAPLYFFVLWRRSKIDTFLLIYWLLFIAGIFYKQVEAFLFPVIAIYILLDGSLDKAGKLKAARSALSVPLVTYLPLMIYEKIYHFAPSDLVLTRVLNPAAPFIPLFQLPAAGGFMLLALYLAGAIFALRHWKNDFVRILILFAVISLFLLNVTPAWMTNRNLMPVFPAFAVFGALLLEWIYKKMPSIAVALLLVFIAESAWLNFASADVELINAETYQHYATPYDELARYIESQQLHKVKIYAPAYSEPSHFYFSKNHIPSGNYVRTFWETSPNQQTLEGLLGYMNRNGIEYVVVPSPEVPRTTRFDRLFWRWAARFEPEHAKGYPNASFFWKTIWNPDLQYRLYEKYNECGFKVVTQVTAGNNSLRLLRLKDFSENNGVQLIVR